MAHKPLTPRQLELQEAQANLMVEKTALRTIRGHAAAQQRRVSAAQQAVNALGACDWCGAKVLPCGEALQLCRGCSEVERQRQRVKFLAQHGYGADGKRLAAA